MADEMSTAKDSLRIMLLMGHLLPPSQFSRKRIPNECYIFNGPRGFI
jgi:hypothetical protein